MIHFVCLTGRDDQDEEGDDEGDRQLLVQVTKFKGY